MARNSIADIASSVARKHGLGKKESVDIVSAFFHIVSEGLRDERLVKVRGLGTFKVMAVKARESVNVNTGERVVIEGHDKVSFVPDATMKELVNKPFAQFTTVVVNDGVNFDSIDAASEAEQHKAETVPTDVQLEAVEEETNAEEEPKEVSAKPQSSDDLHTTEKTPASESNVVAVAVKPDNTNVLAEKDDERSKTASNDSPASTEKEVKNTVTESETVKQKVVEKEIVRQQIVEQKVIKQEQHAHSDAVNVAADSVPRDYFDEQVGIYERRWRRGRIVACALVLVGLAAGFFAGQYSKGLFSNDTAREQSPMAIKDSVKETAEPVQVANTDKAAADSQQTPDKEPQRKEISEGKPEQGQVDLETVNADRRLKYGAYEITGIDKTVVLKKGQTMESYARRHFGSDEMKVYIQALNGIDDMAEGDTMLVPKIRLRKQYRR